MFPRLLHCFIKNSGRSSRWSNVEIWRPCSRSREIWKTNQSLAIGRRVLSRLAWTGYVGICYRIWLCWLSRYSRSSHKERISQGCHLSSCQDTSEPRKDRVQRHRKGEWTFKTTVLQNGFHDFSWRFRSLFIHNLIFSVWPSEHVPGCLLPRNNHRPWMLKFVIKLSAALPSQWTPVRLDSVNFKSVF